MQERQYRFADFYGVIIFLSGIAEAVFSNTAIPTGDDYDVVVTVLDEGLDCDPDFVVASREVLHTAWHAVQLQ
jgi:hypothetical protein